MASSWSEQIKAARKETEKLKEEFEKERQTFQAKIARHEKINNTLQEKFYGAQKTEQTLNDQLRQYRDKLKTTEGARDKLEQFKVALEEEVAARDKKVRELTTELALRNGDLDKKEKELFTTKKDLVDAQAVVEEGKSLEPKLRQKIDELEDEIRELMDDLENTGGKLKKVQKKLTEAVNTQNALEHEREQQVITIRELEGVCDRLSDRVQTLESKLSEKEACCEELEKKCYEEAQNCQLMETERDHARIKADEVLRQSKELYKEHDSLRIAHTQAQQRKKELSKLVMEYEQQMKTERAATAKERDNISLELVALRQEKRDLEENLEVKHQGLMSKQEELNVAESCVLGLQQRIEDLQEEIHIVRKQHDDFVDKLESRAGINKKLEEEKAELEKQLKELQDRNAHLHGQLTENHRVEEKKENELEAARNYWIAAEKRKEVAEAGLLEAKKKNLEAYNQVCSLTEELGKVKRQLSELKEERSTLQDTVSQFQEENGCLKDKCSDLEDDKAKLAEELLKAKRYEYRGKTSEELIMQNLCTQEGSCEHLLEKTQFNAIFKEKLRKAEQQVAQLGDRQQQLEYIEGVAVELKTHLSGFMMDALPVLTPSVGSGEGELSVTVPTQEAAQKVQLLETERDSLKAERHMYQMKWLDAEDMMEAVKNDRQSIQDERDSLLHIKDTLEQEKKDMMAKQTGLEEELRVKQQDLGKTKESLESSKLALHGAKVHLQVTEQTLREEDKRENFKAYEVIKKLQHPQEGSAEYPSEKTTISALMDLCKYFRDENMETLEQTAEEKQKIHASMKEADERVKEMASTIAALKECIQMKDAEVRDLQAQLAPHQGMAVVPVPPPSDVADLTGDEVVLQQLCYMAAGIKQLLISPDGGTFTLGNGDASLKFPPGAVQKDIHIHYAIILYGPFVFPAGYKPGSVVIYLKMDGAILVKPVQLFLSHWCIREETDDEETMKFIRAPHSLESGKREYAFEEIEEEADFTTHANVGVLTIKEPHCLYCVEAKGAKNARYCAMTFTRSIPSEKTLVFRIQLSCDSLDWSQELASVLDQRGWQRTSASRDNVPQFCFSDEQIAASPTVSQGPGWNAMIDGAHKVKETAFLTPKGKSKAALEREVNSGRFPPYICYQILYSVSEERRVVPTFLKVDLHGADVPLTFICRFNEAECSATSVHHSPPHTPQRTADAETPPSSPQAEIQPADVLKALNHQLDAQWWEFGTFLYVERAIMKKIRQDESDVGACMLQLVEKWLHYDDGTGDLPRTWKTVVQAVKDSGNGLLAEQLAKRFGVQLSGH